MRVRFRFEFTCTVCSRCAIVYVCRKHLDVQRPCRIFRIRNAFRPNVSLSVVSSLNSWGTCARIVHKWTIYCRCGSSCAFLSMTFSQTVFCTPDTDACDLIRSNVGSFHASHISTSIWIFCRTASTGSFSRPNVDSRGRSMPVWLSLPSHRCCRRTALHSNGFSCES